jgi:hypothetical protein
MESGDIAAYPRRVPRPPNGVGSASTRRGENVSDGEQPFTRQPDEPMRRPRGRHAVPKAGAVAGDGWRARLAAVAAPVVASVEPRISAAAAWLFERRLHVLIFTVSVATVAMIGGAVALISFAGAQQPGDGAATVVGTDRPTSTDRGVPSSYAPILPSPGPPPSIGPTSTPAPPPEDESVDPVTGAPVEPPTEPQATEPPRSETAPGATNRPDKPKDSDTSEDPNASDQCDEQGLLLDLLLGPRC